MTDCFAIHTHSVVCLHVDPVAPARSTSRLSSCVVQYPLSSLLPGPARCVQAGGLVRTCVLPVLGAVPLEIPEWSEPVLLSFATSSRRIPFMRVALPLLESSALILFSGRSAFSKSVRAFVWSGSQTSVFSPGGSPCGTFTAFQPFSASGSLAV